MQERHSAGAKTDPSPSVLYGRGQQAIILLTVRQWSTPGGVRTPRALTLFPPRVPLQDHVPAAAPSFSPSTGRGGGQRAGYSHLPCGSERGGSRSTGSFKYAPFEPVTGVAWALTALRSPLRCSYGRLSPKTVCGQESEAAAVPCKLWTSKRWPHRNLLPLLTFRALIPICSG